jgi:DNA-binding transcriptional LysR family regulator
MAKAATNLRMSQPSISEAITRLEDTLQVQLLDRGPRGIEPTIYAAALLKRGIVVFDELREGVREIETLGNPAQGAVRVGCPETMAGVASLIIDRMSRRYPQVTVHVVPTEPLMMQLNGLRERSVDLLMGRLAQSLVEEDDIATEKLFDDPYIVAAGVNNRWANRRKVALSDLINERWIIIPQSNLVRPLLNEAFRMRGLDVPRESVTTVSVHVRNHLLATGRFIGLMASSVLRLNAKRWGLKALPIDLGVRQLPPHGILTLKKRTLSPAVRVFIEHAREVAKAMAEPPRQSKLR